MKTYRKSLCWFQSLWCFIFCRSWCYFIFLTIILSRSDTQIQHPGPGKKTQTLSIDILKTTNQRYICPPICSHQRLVLEFLELKESELSCWPQHSQRRSVLWVVKISPRGDADWSFMFHLGLNGWFDEAQTTVKQPWNTWSFSSWFYNSVN